jgi:hypothetical protein
VDVPFRLLLSILFAGLFYYFLKQKEAIYNGFMQFTRSYLRWYLAIYMMIYGLAKMVEGGQFAAPGLSDLAMTYGDFSPMGLLWRFMGYSKVYSAFAGFLEVLAGLLLFFRKTSVLGALLTIGVMSNVFMMNMCYDVPVKLFSFHLVAFACIYLQPNIVRLYRFFMSEATSPLENDADWLPKKWMRITKNTIKGLLITGMLGGAVYFSIFEKPETTETPLQGIYNIENFALNNVEKPLNFQDSIRWSKAIIEDGSFRTIALNGQKKYYKFEPDSILTHFSIENYRDSTQMYDFKVQKDSNLLKINGLWKNDTLQISMRRVDEMKYLLKTRGFRWVNEYPFNR